MPSEIGNGGISLPVLLSTHTPRTFKSSKSSSKNVNLLTQQVRVLHQRVCLDVDLSKKRIEGFTELTVIPTTGTLKVIKLDCREMKISGVFVNGRKSNYIFQDLLHINSVTKEGGDDGDEVAEEGEEQINLFDYYSNNLTIHQHHLIKQKLSYVFGEHNYDPRDPPREHISSNTEELSVFFPENLKLELSDIQSLNTPGGRMGNLAHILHATGTPLRTKNTFSSESYTPVVIKIEYEVINPQNGVVFATGSKEDKKLWHAYTMNSEYNISTSSWVPCIDNLWERLTWSVELSIPRTVNDIGFPRVIGTKEAMKKKRMKKTKKNVDNATNDNENDNNTNTNDANTNKNNNNNNNANDDVDDDEDDEDDDEDSDDDLDNHDLVVCTGDFNNIKETPHPIDLSKKVVAWSIFNPICAHHVGWAVGSFETVAIPSNKKGGEEQKEDLDLIADRDDDEDGETLEKDNGDTPLVVYCLPNMTDMAMNLCIFFNNAIDFFLKEFGSYPFSSYAMVFVANNPTPTHNFAGVSMVSDTLLYSPNLIEPIISSTEILLDCISLQWSGINVVPQTYNDIWCTIGISTFMSYQFIRKLMGVNEYRFKMKSKMSEITDLDIGGKSPLALQFFRFPISTNDLDFIKLKSPLVLYILDKRMTKTDKSFGLTRVLPKVFLQAMSGDLPNGTLSTQHFQYVCEKVNRNKLDSFFKQWVYGAGVPIFRISQKFNKKRSIIEMSIRQVQQQETKHLHPKPETFINDSIAFLEDEPSFMIRPVFSGPMTIRIHEADGVPYEHIVEIKEGNMRLDIQYNSKFRRKKREEQQDEVDGVNGATSSMVAVPAVGVISDFSKLGDVLTKPREVEEWGLAEWSKRDEEDFNNDAFEWIRVDADFEWIAKIEVQQPDYMYGTQLQHDRDVEAQYESIRYFGDREKSNVTYCTALTRTIMDPRYYYGIRISAAKALGQLSNERNSFIGVKYLLKIFKELYCFKGSSIPLSNNFNDFNSFFLQRAIPEILSNIRDDDGNVPFVIKNLLLNLVKFNDNTDNEFTDCFYISDLMTALTTSALSIQLQTEESSNEDSNRNGSTNKDGKFLEEVITEVKRLQKLDEWIPLYQSIVSLTALKQKIRLATYGKLKLLFEDLLYYTLAKYPEDVRIEAFRGLFVLGGLKNKSILQYYLKCCLLDPKTSPYLRKRLVEILLESICIAAIKGTPSTLDDPEFKPYASMLRESDSATSVVGGDSGVGGTAIVVEDGASKSSEINTRRDAFARATLQGAIELLRRDYSIGEGLKEILWELLHSSLLSIYERRITFTLCEVLYQQWDSFPLTLSIPPLPLEELKKKFVVKVLGGGKIVIKREGRNMILFGKKEKKDAVPPVESKVDPVVVAPVAEPKLKLKLGGTSSKKPITITLGPPSKPKTLPKKEKKTATLPPPPPPAAPALREVPSTGTAAVVPSSSSPPLKLALKTTKPVPSMSVRTSTKSILTNKHIHVKNGKVTIKFSKEKFNKQNASVFDFPDPTPKPHTSLVKVKGTTVTFSLKSKQKKQEPSNFDMDNSRSLPNRYVKILLKSKKVSISSTPF